MTSPGALGALRRFANHRTVVDEKCELCSKRLEPAHPHLVEPPTRRIVCACDPCALTFSTRSDARYRQVPRDVADLGPAAVPDAAWEALGLPVHLVFFVRSTPAGGRVVALFPSPAGAMESTLPLAGWEALERGDPRIAELAPDVEALLVYRVRDERLHLKVPIDECYRLVGLVRARKGHVSNAGVDGEVATFLETLKQRAR